MNKYLFADSIGYEVNSHAQKVAFGIDNYKGWSSVMQIMLDGRMGFIEVVYDIYTLRLDLKAGSVATILLSFSLMLLSVISSRFRDFSYGIIYHPPPSSHLLPTLSPHHEASLHTE